ncbi:BIG2 domain-containing protein [Ruminococcaceae bacterium BL-6]|nr:BIG2 domain-containing protein [Ruminococcaceae bacterium BL-6]
MKKTKGKVLSLILAGALVVSSFSSLNFASAASSRETGKLDFDDDEIYLVSQRNDTSKKVDLEELVGGSVTLETYDHEDASDMKYVSYTHDSGDRLVNIKEDSDNAILTVKKDVAGEEKVTVTYEGEYDRDDGRTVKVRGSKQITIHADVAGRTFLAKYVDPASFDPTERPDDIETAAVNDQYLDLGLYTVKGTGTDGIIADYLPVSTASYAKKDAEGNVVKDSNGNVVVNDSLLELDDDDDVFTNIAVATSAEAEAEAPNRIRLTTKLKQGDANDEFDLADTDKDTLKIKLLKTDSEGVILKGDNPFESSRTNYKVEIAKKWNTALMPTKPEKGKKHLETNSSPLEINKKGGKTYIAPDSVDWDDWEDSDKNVSQSISGYEVVSDYSVTVKGGNVGNIKVNGNSGNVTVDGGTVGDIKAAIVEIEGGSVGTIKDKAKSVSVSGGKVKAIDASDDYSNTPDGSNDKKGTPVDISGGTITGDVEGWTVTIDSEDEDVPTSIGGNVTANNDDNDDDETVKVSSSSGANVEVKGIVKGAVTLEDDNVTVGTVDADYNYTTTFDGFNGKVGTLRGTDNQEVDVQGDSKVTLSKKLVADSVTVEDGSKLTIPEGTIGSVDGEGTLAVPAGKLFIEDSFDEATLQLTEGLVVGATAFQSYDNTVDVDDVNTLGYTLEKKSVNDDVDKFVIKDVKFAGLSFDKSNVSVAKGYDTTLTVANYPDGTALPADAQIEWYIDANDDYFQMTVEGNTATVKVLDYSKDYASDNKATVTATVVDANGNTLTDEDGNAYVEATANLTATALPESKLTLDTKSVTIGTGNIYQFLAKSSTDAAITAASSDTQIATVDEINPNDPRGHKFQIAAVAEGKATITVTDANGATGSIAVTVAKVNGTLKADTTSYTMAPGNIYDVKFSVTGTTATPVVTCNGKVVSVAPRGNGVYRITGVTPGTAYVQATVGATHVTVTVKVVAGAAASGVKGNNVSVLR